MNYNYFGLEYYDILNLFSGEETDFETPGKNNGKQNIIDEMDIQLGNIVSRIPVNILRLFNRVQAVLMDQEKEYIDGVGTRFRFPDGLPPLVTGIFNAWYIDNPNVCTESESVSSLTTSNYACANIPLCAQGTSVTVETVSGSSGAFYGITEDIDLTDYNLYVSYEVDNDSTYFEIKELKAKLRDAVACVMGSKLLMQNETDWKLLDIVCSNKFEPAAGWVPAELKSLKFWQTPWRTGLSVGKFNRV